MHSSLPGLTRLSACKLTQLKQYAFLLGLSTAGTKAELELGLQSHLAQRDDRVCNPGRILSVDMGIRNLAFCVLDTPTTTGDPLIVSAWKRMDLLQQPPATDISSVAELSTHTPKKPVKSAVPATAFTPSVLSHTAYKLTSELLRYKPNTILIERQRFRSGGAAAIQEWTVRVNMLESMIWACLRALRETSECKEDFPKVHEVLPARVAGFWTASDQEQRKVVGDVFESINVPPEQGKIIVPTRKIDKKAKIAVVHSWLRQKSTVDNDVSLVFEGDADGVATAFRSAGQKTTIRKSATDKADKTAGGEIGKLDDLADCLLQAVAWARWRENRSHMIAILEKR